MQYQKFRPQEILSPFVECYFIWESQQPLDKEMIIESPPSSYPGIVFNYGEPYFLQNKKYPRLAVPQQFVAGLSTYSFKLFLSGRIGIAGIVLKPAALSTLFGLESYEYTEERMDLFTVLKERYVQTYAEKIRQAEGTVDKVRLMEDFLLHHYKLTRPETDYIDHAANVIAESNGMLHMHDLLKESCMSRRTFERRFFRKVGLSPKYYGRIRRIGYVANLIAGKKKVNWPEVFYQAEFFDQAHFIKDFEEFTGRSPQQYLKENTELANFVEKPTTQSLQ